MNGNLKYFNDESIFKIFSDYDKSFIHAYFKCTNVIWICWFQIEGCFKRNFTLVASNNKLELYEFEERSLDISNYVDWMNKLILPKIVKKYSQTFINIVETEENLDELTKLYYSWMSKKNSRLDVMSWPATEHLGTIIAADFKKIFEDEFCEEGCTFYDMWKNNETRLLAILRCQFNEQMNIIKKLFLDHIS